MANPEQNIADASSKPTGSEASFTTIRGYQDYEINRLGTVRKINGGDITFSINSNGYVSGNLFNSQGVRKTNVTLHRLLMATFKSNPEDLSDIDHIDGDKTNNSLDNLEYVTHAENMRRAGIMGLIPKDYSSELNPASKLTQDEADYIFDMYHNQYYRGLVNDLCDRFGVSRRSIRNITKGLSYVR